MQTSTPRVFVLFVALVLGPPAVMVALHYNAWLRPKPIDPNLARGEVLVFDAKWCGACQAMKPIVRRLQDEGFDIREVDVDKNRGDAMKFAVHEIPAFILVRDGQEVRRAIGVMSPDNVRQLWR
jgi:thioredoxin 1